MLAFKLRAGLAVAAACALSRMAPAATREAKASPRASSIDAAYTWQVLRVCPGGALWARTPAYPGRLLIIQDLGCGADYLDVDARRVRFTGDERRVIWPVPLEWPPGPRAIGVCTPAGCDAAWLPVAPVEYPLSEITVATRFTKPSPRDEARIKEDRALIERTFSAAALDGGSDSPALADVALWHAPFVRPRPPVYTSLFGAERVINGKQHTRHLGLDFDGKTGEPMHAAQDGLVVLARNLFYSGGSVFIAHGGQLFTTYFHMSEIGVREGAFVHAGDFIGKVGKTGRVTGPHLHFSAKLNGVYFDPVELFDLAQTIEQLREWR